MPDVVVTSAVDGAHVRLAKLFEEHAFTVLLIDGATPTNESYKRLVGIALDIAARWGARVGAYLVTRRNERPFEVPCEVPILFDDQGEVAATYWSETERAYVIDARGDTTLTMAPADAAALFAHLEARVDGP